VKSAQVLLIDDLRLDLATRRVFRDAVEIELGRLTFDLLAALARAAPAALSSHEIAAQVWDSRVVSDETLKQRVSLLRRALGQDSSREYVQTVHSFGYRLVTLPVPLDEPGSSANRAPFARGGEDPSQARTQAASPRDASPPGARLLRALLLILAVLALILLITVLAMVVRQVKRWTPESLGLSDRPGSGRAESAIVRVGCRQGPGRPGAHVEEREPIHQPLHSPGKPRPAWRGMVTGWVPPWHG